jgi:hypothetical protein
VVLVRSGYRVERTEAPAGAAKRPLAGREMRVVVEDVTAEAVLRDADDHFQWFVDLFIAEYASEAKPRPDLPI